MEHRKKYKKGRTYKRKENRNKNKRHNRKKTVNKQPKEHDNSIDPNIELPLENKWTLWLHKKDNRNWGRDSFHKIYDITTVQNFWQVYNNVIFDTELLFLMKNDIFPLWEDPQNASGGTWSMKIPRQSANEIWTNICLLLIGETMSLDMDHINGISIRPKFSNSIIKLWTNTKLDTFNKHYNMNELTQILGNDYEFDDVHFIKFNDDDG